MAEERIKSNDLVLAPGEFAFIADNTKGGVDVCTGPYKVSLSDTERPVVYNPRSKRFESANLTDKQLFITAPEAWYVVLKNPAQSDKHPNPNSRLAMPDLNVGRKVNVPGPVSFPLWPGQMAKVIRGHALRSNQYLLCRVYDDQAARENWKNQVVKVQTQETGGDGGGEKKPDAGDVRPGVLQSKEARGQGLAETAITMGQLLIVKGTEVAFYIPPTGIEVVWDGSSVDDNEKQNLVRDAVTLEALEYCILLDQNGSKRIEQGPAVVFPRPTEVFVEKEIKDAGGLVVDTVRKFRAIELTDHSGIYVKVITAYQEGDVQYEEGQELFITGKQNKIYFPREEHAVIRYGDREVHYATAIPEGEGRYLLDRDKGGVHIVMGPTMLLPNPIQEVIVKRALDRKLVEYLYPGNSEALSYNQALLASMGFAHGSNATPQSDGGGSVTMDYMVSAMSNEGYGATRGLVAATAMPIGDTAQGRGIVRKAGKAIASDSITRNQGYTEPRSIMLNTRYQGPPAIDVWTGYAVMLVRKSGERRVITGPKTALLEYDEVPQIMTLSTGKPKTTDKLEKTAYLCVSANKVSDIIYIETKDMVGMRVKLSYRVNFEGDPYKWFAVDNYVKFMCDHMKSKLRDAVMRYDVEYFYAHAVDVLRECILGEENVGTRFAENGMHIYDVEVLALEFLDQAVQTILVEQQRSAIKQRLEQEAAKRMLGHVTLMESYTRDVADARAETAMHSASLTSATIKRDLGLALERFESDMAQTVKRHAMALADENAAAEQQEVENERARATRVMESEMARLDAQVRMLELQAEVQAVVEKAKAISPQLVEALNTFGERAMVERITTAIGPMSLFGGGTVPEIVTKVFAGTPLAKYLKPAPNGVKTDLVTPTS